MLNTKRLNIEHIATRKKTQANYNKSCEKPAELRIDFVLAIDLKKNPEERWKK